MSLPFPSGYYLPAAFSTFLRGNETWAMYVENMTFKLNTTQWNNGNKDKQIIDFYLDGSNYRILFSLHNVNIARNEYKKRYKYDLYAYNYDWTKNNIYSVKSIF